VPIKKIIRIFLEGGGISLKALKNSYRRAVFAWLAMVFGIFFYLLLVELFKPDIHFLQKGSSSPEVIPLKYFLLSFSALTLFLIWFVRSQILTGKARGGKTPASRLLTASILTDALCEMMAINGLTLFLLTRNPLNFYIFLLLSLALFTYFFPRYAQWEEWAGRTKGIEGSTALAR
jgi:hypothetical protein